MNLSSLFTMQRALDTYIEEHHHLKEENLFSKKLLALQVEIAELANETRCFKFWSLKDSSPRTVILEEFVDGVHFILSLGLELGVKEMELGDWDGSTEEVTEQFLNILGLIHVLREYKELPDYEVLVHEYFYLGTLLGFTGEEIIKAYHKKNEVNYKRQQEGY
ncbi:dUTP diphosphatase [Bacillus coahuilensis]|uniref:dUTP diphosphatase n=1 Tax=Bacillus coahuilensis TaxID=408580 RepID=UPI000185118D|nr:dUTP diphosphatase [Bacillus coahuilensis]